MTLLTIHSSQENQWVYENLVKDRVDVWLDATDDEQEGRWKWYKQSKEWTPKDSSVFQQWRAGEPNNKGTRGKNENCIVMSNEDGQWVDIPCGWAYAAVCKCHL